MTGAFRQIVKINEEKCDGCGLCIPSCAEGALQIIDGKARLLEDRLCDGLGNCLGECPQDAIEIIEREAVPFDEEAVEKHLRSLDEAIQYEELEVAPPMCGGGCPGSSEKMLRPEKKDKGSGQGVSRTLEPELNHWPIQLHLVAPQARFLQEPEMLIAADCVPFAYPDFHAGLLQGKSLMIGCPKLDDVARYREKLIEIFQRNASTLQKITLAYMEVPCCFGLSQLVKTAVKDAGVNIPIEEVVIGVDGSIKQ